MFSEFFDPFLAVCQKARNLSLAFKLLETTRVVQLTVSSLLEQAPVLSFKYYIGMKELGKDRSL